MHPLETCPHRSVFVELRVLKYRDLGTDRVTGSQHGLHVVVATVVLWRQSDACGQTYPQLQGTTALPVGMCLTAV